MTEQREIAHGECQRVAAGEAQNRVQGSIEQHCRESCHRSRPLTTDVFRGLFPRDWGCLVVFEVAASSAGRVLNALESQRHTATRPRSPFRAAREQRGWLRAHLVPRVLMIRNDIEPAACDVRAGRADSQCRHAHDAACDPGRLAPAIQEKPFRRARRARPDDRQHSGAIQAGARFAEARQEAAVKDPGLVRLPSCLHARSISEVRSARRR